MASSLHEDGYIFDLGIHGLFPSEPGNEKFVEEICSFIPPEDIIRVVKRTGIYFNGGYFHYPLSFSDMFRAMNVTQTFRAGLDFVYHRLLLRLGVQRDTRSFKQWITAHFGSVLYNLYFGPYAEKVWGIPGDELEAESLVRRVTTISLWDVMKKAARQLLGMSPERKKEYSQQPFTFIYGKHGAITYPRYMAEFIRKKGGTIQLSHSLTGIETRDKTITALRVNDDNGNEQRVECEYLVYGGSLKDLIAMLQPAVPEDIQQHADALRYRSLIFVNLEIHKSRVYPYQWVYYSGDSIFNRINEYPNLTDEGDATFAPRGKTSLGVEIACFKGDELWNLDDSELIDRTLHDIERLDIVDKEHVGKGTVVRFPNVYPLYDLWTTQNLEKVLDFVSGFENLFLVGRQATFRYINMDEAFAMGTRAAHNCIKETG